MELILGDGRREAEVAIQVNALSATVADLEDALAPFGRPPAGLFVGRRQLDREDRLSEAGLYRGAKVSFIAEGEGHLAPSVVFCVIGGLEAGRSSALTDGEYSIGRDASCAIVLPSQTVSPRHCTIMVRGGVARVVDNGSLAGTRVDGIRIDDPQGATLTSSSVVEAGNVAFCIRSCAQDDRATMVDPSRYANESGEIPFNRPPRPAAPSGPPEVTVPQGPGEAPKPPFNVIAVGSPAIFGLVMVVVTHNILFALTALLSPVMAVGNWLDGRHRATKASRTSARDYRIALETFRQQFAIAVVIERARRQAVQPDIAEVLRRASLPSTRLWERRSGEGFLQLSAGLGAIAWSPPLDDRDRSAMAPEVAALVAQHSILPTMPLVVDLALGGPVGVVGDRHHALAVARSLILQAAVHHGPVDVRMLVFVDDDRVADWDWMKWLPHVRDVQGGDTRLLFAGTDNCNRAARELLDSTRLQRGDQMTSGPMLFIVVDAKELTRGRDAPVRDLLRGRKLRATGIVIANTEDNLPDACTSLVHLSTTPGDAIVSYPQAGLVVKNALAVGVSEPTARRCARQVARYEDPEITVPGAGLPRKVRIASLLEMESFDPDVVRQRWHQYNVSRLALGRANPLDKPPMAGVIGRSEDGVVSLDLVSDGPHGLIGGTTGAGKTELLRSLVLGLASTASPTYLNFVFIDFKGGAGFETLAVLPHAVGLMTNLDTDLAERSLQCLQAEIRFRQQRFNELTPAADELHQYWLRSDRPLPRLVVIIDEFAEMAKALPDFLPTLISIGRVGRSLGVHLVLATQRPSGVVSPELKANTNFAIALRCREAAESTDLIGITDAAAIPAKHAEGRAYLQVGAAFGRPPILFQSALSSDRVGQVVRRPVDVASFSFGSTVQIAGAAQTASEPEAATELTRLVKAMGDAFVGQGDSKPRKPWTDPLPRSIDLDHLVPLPTPTAPVRDVPSFVPLALADDLDNQIWQLAGWDLRAGNLLFYGVKGSGTTTALGSLALSIARSFPVGRAQIYVMDLGAGQLEPLAGLPSVGGVVSARDSERQQRLIQQLKAELNDRKGAGGSRTGRPTVFLLIDNYGAMSAVDEAAPGVIDGIVQLFTEGPDVDIMVAATADQPSAITYKLADRAPQKWALRLSDKNDYQAFGLPRRQPTTLSPGRAVLAGSSLVAQIGAPLPSLADAVFRQAAASERPDVPPPRIGVMPDHVATASIAMMARMDQDPWFVPIGVGSRELMTVGWTLHSGEHALVLGPGRAGKSEFLAALATIVRMASPEIVILGLVSRRSSALASCRALTTLVSAEDQLGDVLSDLMASDSRVLLLVDDCQDVTDSTAQLEAFVAAARPNAHLIGAARPDDLPSYSHWTLGVRKSRLGLILRVSNLSDASPVSARLPISGWDTRPGRGYLAVDGTVELVHVASSDGQ